MPAHKHPKVKEWLEKQPRFHIHFTPTCASWLNMVERFFRSISTDRLQRGVFRSVPELIVAIEEYIAVHNQNPKPFVWTAKANDILQLDLAIAGGDEGLFDPSEEHRQTDNQRAGYDARKFTPQRV